ncbi:hypothetical protein DDL23_06755 [Staphylococcus aureus]|nr:hypothetical protein DDL23_06755 [Staphylococcus aureus]PVG63825.1 hypothetical protein DDL26_12185 [Staphylococcus aureus]PVG69792.1 hypothetical protein DDL27_11105 [Staphylococcus aureus]PVG78221.1 hypothetical protein DDL24_12080 [Staphylococcus aureus]PVV92883.1 hypothetical protein DDL25_07315 [Staphylococcus aureus]
MLYHLLHQCCITKNDTTPTITFYTTVLHHSKNDATFDTTSKNVYLFNITYIKSSKLSSLTYAICTP